MTPLNTILLTIVLVLAITIMLPYILGIVATVLYWIAVAAIALVGGIVKIFQWLWRRLTRK